MRTRLPALAAIVLVAGCGHVRPPVRAGRRLAAPGSTRSPDNCVEAVTLMGFSPVAPEVLLDTHIDAVNSSGERAAATARTSAVIDGLMGQVSLVQITLRWADGHWLIDRRTECLSGDLLERVIGEIRERMRGTRGACAT